MSADDLGKRASDFTRKAGDFADQHRDKIEEALQSEQAEQVSDKLLDGAAGFANRVTGGKFADRVEGVRSNLDDRLGNE
ncbi:antitoxin [Leucobacter sp. CSA1]|uniref:Antitoxin n=1 Tax=Leucobacter chromiisoli TaxID=2796471 RepID=A0A934Q838_9MICO|nr:antitoxin [Leucobacter chromiisoli]MBK0419546.1 antitoxin [Leucobacter chromiisoli]